MRKILIRVALIISLVPLLLFGVSCKVDEEEQSLPFFPALKEPANTNMEALARGWLVKYDNCLRLKPFYYFSKGELVIWPYGYSLKTEGKNIWVLDGERNKVARAGSWIKMGGGTITGHDSFIEELIGGPLPEGVEGPYWLAGEIVD